MRNYAYPVLAAAVASGFNYLTAEVPAVADVLAGLGIDTIWVMTALWSLFGFTAMKANPIGGKEASWFVKNVTDVDVLPVTLKSRK